MKSQILNDKANYPDWVRQDKDMMVQDWSCCRHKKM